MQILVSSDGHVCCDDELIRRLEGVVEGTLDRFGDRITGVDVHLGDLGTHNPVDRDKSCRLEARLGSAQPVRVSHEAGTLTEAIHGAADKLRRAVAFQILQLTETGEPPRDANRQTGGLFGDSGPGVQTGDPVV